MLARPRFCSQAGAILREVDVSGDGGIMKLVLKEGDGTLAAAGQTVHAHYDGKLASDGKQFDSSRKRGQPFTFPLGKGRVIKGWDAGFATMSVGEKAVLVIKPEYGYGARGAGGAIPGGATLYFEVELMSLSGKAEL
jgi:FKBP-type peptidyl-prolyl cis-trans isomerase